MDGPVVEDQLPAPLGQELVLEAFHAVLLQDVQVVQGRIRNIHIPGRKWRAFQQLSERLLRGDAVQCEWVLGRFQVLDVQVSQVIGQVRRFDAQQPAGPSVLLFDAQDAPQLPLGADQLVQLQEIGVSAVQGIL